MVVACDVPAAARNELTAALICAVLRVGLVAVKLRTKASSCKFVNSRHSLKLLKGC